MRVRARLAEYVCERHAMGGARGEPSSKTKAVGRPRHYEAAALELLCMFHELLPSVQTIPHPHAPDVVKEGDTAHTAHPWMAVQATVRIDLALQRLGVLRVRPTHLKYGGAALTVGVGQSSVLPTKHQSGGDRVGRTSVCM